MPSDLEPIPTRTKLDVSTLIVNEEDVEEIVQEEHEQEQIGVHALAQMAVVSCEEDAEPGTHVDHEPVQGHVE